MLLTLPIILGIMALTDTSAANIYARIRAFYQYNKNLPDALGTFFFAESNPPGFFGVTKDVLIKTVQVLHETGGWLDGPDVTRKLIFETVATMVADATNCDRAGIVKFCNWCFIAAKGDESIKKYFANPTAKYTVLDKVKDTVIVTEHKVDEKHPRCIKRIYDVETCTACDYIKETLISETYIVFKLVSPANIEYV